MCIIRTWWRNEALSREQQYLLEALFEAHHQSCFRPNVSTVTVVNAAAGSNDIASAIAAGILTTGGRHAPIKETYDFLGLDQPSREVGLIIQSGRQVPGWGGTFQKGAPDPIWKLVEGGLHEFYHDLSQDMDAVTSKLHELGKDIYPNPSCYTAATAIALDMPREAAVCLFISARLDAWSSIAFSQLEK